MQSTHFSLLLPPFLYYILFAQILLIYFCQTHHVDQHRHLLQMWENIPMAPKNVIYFTTFALQLSFFVRDALLLTPTKFEVHAGHATSAMLQQIFGCLLTFEMSTRSFGWRLMCSHYCHSRLFEAKPHAKSKAILEEISRCSLKTFDMSSPLLRVDQASKLFKLLSQGPLLKGNSGPFGSPKIWD